MIADWHQALAAFVKAGALETVRGSAGEGYEVELTERATNVDMKVTVAGLPAGSGVLSMREVDHPGWVEGLDYRRKCDFLIFMRWQGEVAIVLVELKKKIGGDTKAFRQLRRTRPIVDYCVAMAAPDETGFQESSCWYVVIAERADERFDKQRLRVPPSGPAWERDFEGRRMKVFLDRRITVGALIGEGI